mmetsp:Transcript_22956/g.48118  ORF Transcript_22956/g.48118 Transcript_22956/m.48118 type:complete len:223 (+) Transcript_22956:1475-2143(+)
MHAGWSRTSFANVMIVNMKRQRERSRLRMKRNDGQKRRFVVSGRRSRLVDRRRNSLSGRQPKGKWHGGRKRSEGGRRSRRRLLEKLKRSGSLMRESRPIRSHSSMPRTGPTRSRKRRRSRSLPTRRRTLCRRRRRKGPRGVRARLRPVLDRPRRHRSTTLRPQRRSETRMRRTRAAGVATATQSGYTRSWSRWRRRGTSQKALRGTRQGRRRRALRGSRACS